MKVCTDRLAFHDQFEKQMRRIWDIKPEATFKQIEKGVYQVELTNRFDYQKILDEGPWFYRQDLVATAPCNSPQAAMNPEIRIGELWVQYHNIPLDSLTEEGVAIVTRPVGRAISDPVPGYIAGRHFFKVKMEIDLSSSLKDAVKARHPSLGEVKVHTVYEGVGRACLFCAKLGHEIGTCKDRNRLTRIRNKEENRNKPELENILKPTIGSWVLNPMLIPDRENSQSQQKPPTDTRTTRPKRSLDETGEGHTGWQMAINEHTVQGRDREDGEMSEGEPSDKVLNKKPKAARQTSPPVPI